MMPASDGHSPRADAVLSFLRAPDLMSAKPWRRGISRRDGNDLSGRSDPGRRRSRAARLSAEADSRWQTIPPERPTSRADSGGDVFSVDDAPSLEDTLMRLRQRYALNYNSAATIVSDQHPGASGSDQRCAPPLSGCGDSLSPGFSFQGFPAGRSHLHHPRSPSRGWGGVESADRATPSNGIDELTTPKRKRVGVDQTYGSSVNLAGNDSDNSAPAAGTRSTQVKPRTVSVAILTLILALLPLPFPGHDVAALRPGFIGRNHG